ncbi:membrane-associated phospholipid phosphatase [Arthrobacter sp. CAN_A2]|uniref:phosphatase PAP2 family protein n=1 Tax=Arthrobacter sp. CAN_A2 TaxID=2787718 RepID=UPI0018F02B87
MTGTRPVLSAPPQPGAVAAAISEICAPAVLVSLFLVGTALGAAGWPNGILYAVVATGFTTALPLAAVLILVRRGYVTDHHISDRRQRAPVLAGTLVSIAVGLWALTLLGAPRVVTGAVWCTVAGVAVVLLVNLCWKLSAHSAVAVFVTAGTIAVVGPAALLLLVVPAAVGWSRVRLRAHTPSQVAAGFLLGGLIGAGFAMVVVAG